MQPIVKVAITVAVVYGTYRVAKYFAIKKIVEAATKFEEEMKQNMPCTDPEQAERDRVETEAAKKAAEKLKQKEAHTKRQKAQERLFLHQANAQRKAAIAARNRLRRTSYGGKYNPI